MLIAVASVKGSPGSTTLALALSALWPRGAGPAVMVEADCAGGDVAGRCWVPDGPGLAGLATAARTGIAVLGEYSVGLPCGADVVVAPTERQPATVAVGLLAEAGPQRWAKEGTAIVDVGRLDPGAPATELALGADVLLLCFRGDEASLSRLVTGVPHARNAELLVVGDTRYSTAEIEHVIGLPVTALPWDERGARAVWGAARPSASRSRHGCPPRFAGWPNDSGGRSPPASLVRWRSLRFRCQRTTRRSGRGKASMPGPGRRRGA